MAVSENHLAHPYVDIAHRAALLYSFATLLIAVFVELSGMAHLGEPHRRDGGRAVLRHRDRHLHQARREA